MAVKPKLDKAALKELSREKRAAAKAHRRQVLQAFKTQRREDKSLVPTLVGVFLLPLVIGFGVGFPFGLHWAMLPLGVAVGLMVAITVFGRRMKRSVYAKAEGQPGAAGWALDSMQGQWRVTQGVAGTTHLDAVHRVVGRPGVILVAEGVPHRAKSLLAQEKKRMARVVGSVPIYDVVVGNDEGQIPLKKLQHHLGKLPRNITQQQMDDIETRLAALGSRAAALPKGPMPPGAKMRSVQRSIRRR